MKTETSIDIFSQIDFYYTGDMSKEGTAALIQRVCEKADEISRIITHYEGELKKNIKGSFSHSNAKRALEVHQEALDKCNKFLSDTRDFKLQNDGEEKG